MKRAALFIGVNEYQAPLTRLLYAREDAAALYQLFLKDYTPELVHFLSDPDSDSIINKLKYIMSQLSEGDLFLFYFSGHGIEIQNNHYLLSSKAENIADQWRHCVSENMLEALTKKKGVQSIFIFDSCRENIYAGARNVSVCEKSRGVTMKRWVEQKRKRGFLSPIVFCSCSGGEKAYEVNQCGHGIFTLALLDTLNKNKTIAFDDLASDVTRKIQVLMTQYNLAGQQTPEVIKNPLVNPMLWGNAEENIGMQAQKTSCNTELLDSNYRLQTQVEEQIEDIKKAGYDRGQTFGACLDRLNEDYNAAKKAWDREDYESVNRLYQRVIENAKWIKENAPLRSDFQKLETELAKRKAESDGFHASDFVADLYHDAVKCAENAFKDYDLGKFVPALSSIRSAIEKFTDAGVKARQETLNHLLESAEALKKDKKWKQLKKTAEQILPLNPDKAGELTDYANRKMSFERNLHAARKAQSALIWHKALAYAESALAIEPNDSEAEALRQDAETKRNQLDLELSHAQEAKEAKNWQDTLRYAQNALSVGMSSEAAALKTESETNLEQQEHDLACARQAKEAKNWKDVRNYAEAALQVGISDEAQKLLDTAEKAFRQLKKLLQANKAKKEKNWQSVLDYAKEILKIDASDEAEALKQEAARNLEQLEHELTCARHAKEAKNWKNVLRYAEAALQIGICDEASVLKSEAEYEINTEEQCRKESRRRKHEERYRAVLISRMIKFHGYLWITVLFLASLINNLLSQYTGLYEFTLTSTLVATVFIAMVLGVGGCVYGSRIKHWKWWTWYKPWMAIVTFIVLMLLPVNRFFLQRAFSEDKMSIPYGITKISTGMFRNSSLRSIDIPSTVKYIGPYAFAESQNLTIVTLPHNVEIVDAHAFYQCKKLKTVTLPKNLKKIGKGTFSGCTKLSDIKLPSDLQVIGAETFKNCTSLTSIHLPANLKTLEMGMFSGCTKLSDIKLPADLQVIGAESFEKCISLTEILLPAKLEKIEFGAFCDCSSLIQLHIPENVSVIENAAFSGCSKLIDVKLPSGLNKIACELFAGCRSLRKIILPDGVTTIEAGAFAYCDTLSVINISDKVKTFGAEAFLGCKKLDVALHARLGSYYCDNSMVEDSVRHCMIAVDREKNAESAFILGRFYFYGDYGKLPNGKPDYEKAAHYYKIAMAGRFGYAFNGMAILYSYGYDKLPTGEPNYKVAVKYLLIAIEKYNIPVAMYNLGAFYHRGYYGKLPTGEPDYEKARYYYEMAKQNGYKKAEDALLSLDIAQGKGYPDTENKDEVSATENESDNVLAVFFTIIVIGGIIVAITKNS